MPTTDHFKWNLDTDIDWQDDAPLEKARPPTQSRALLELADRLSPKIRKQFLAAIDRIKSKVDWRAVNAAIERGDVDGALKSMGLGRWSSELGGMTDVMSAAFNQAGVNAARSVAAGLVGAKVSVRFDQFHPRAAEAAFRNNYGLVQGFVDEQRKRLRGVIESAVRSGEAPIATSRQIRSSVRAFGLDDRRAEALSRYRDQLENGRFGDAAARAVGGNVERTLNAASSGRIELAQSRINDLVDQYEQRLLMQRAGAIADTESMRAVSQGNREAFEQVFDQLGGGRDNVLRFWVATDDNKTRDSHRLIPQINDEGVGMDEPYKLPEGGTIMYPHDPDAPANETINCRCTEVYRLADVPESILPEAVAGRSILPVAKEDPGLYVCRYLTVASAMALQEYAKSLGLTNLVPPHKMHVTVLYSSVSISVQPQGTVVPAKPITMPQPLGAEGAMVLFLDAPEVSARHDALVRAGAKHDYPTFQPHVTLSYDAGSYDPSAAEVRLPPAQIMLGFEAAAPINRDWVKDEGLKKGYNPDQPRDDHGEWTGGDGGGSSGGEGSGEEGGGGRKISGKEALTNYKSDDPYAQGAAIALNAQLRQAKGDTEKLPQKERDAVDAIDNEFRKAPRLKEPMTVYRGVGEENAPGKDAFYEHAYASTSMDRDTADMFSTLTGGSDPVVYAITLPKGMRVLKTDHLERATNGIKSSISEEKEVLLPRGIWFEKTGRIGNTIHLKASGGPRWVFKENPTVADAHVPSANWAPPKKRPVGRKFNRRRSLRS